MNEQLTRQINQLVQRIQARSPAEKITLLGVLLAGLFMSFLSVVYDPLTASRELTEQEIASINRQIQGQQTAYTQKVAQSQEDPNKFANDRLAVIIVEQQRLDREFSELAGDLVSPNTMTQILTTALQRQSGLELVSVQNRSANALYSAASSGAGAQTNTAGAALSNLRTRFTGQVYQHGISLEFTGDFFSTLRYLQLLEQLTTGFYWDSIVFTLTQWPAAAVKLELHTLSTERGFLGV